MVCLFCNYTARENKKLPLNHFNNKTFCYCSCDQCDLLFINPIPSLEDLELMYPSSYQQGVDKTIESKFAKQPGLRYPYHFIFNLFQQKNSGSKIVDFGCGNGKFIWNALKEGFSVDGVEYGKEQVQKLSEEIKESSFFTVEGFFLSKVKYDIIFMSNVLEHFTKPNIEFNELKRKLNKNGQVVVEGPLEKNTSLVNFFKWKYFELRKRLNANYSTAFPPVHVFYSNYKNQLAFFENNGFQTIKFELMENTWPYPNSVREINSFGSFIKLIVAKLSVLFSSTNSKYGNTFIYVGQMKEVNEK